MPNDRQPINLPELNGFLTVMFRDVEITKVPFANVIVGAALAAKLKYIAAKAAPTVVLDKLVRL